MPFSRPPWRRTQPSCTQFSSGTRFRKHIQRMRKPNLNETHCIFQLHKTKKFTHKSKAYAGSAGPKINSAALLYAAKKNDYERVKVGIFEFF